MGTPTNFPFGVNAGTTLATSGVGNFGTVQVGGAGVGYSMTNLVKHSATLSPALVAAAETAEQTFAVAGVLSTDMLVAVNKPTAQAGLAVTTGRVIAAGSIGITFANVTAASITPTAGEVYSILTASLA